MKKIILTFSVFIFFLNASVAQSVSGYQTGLGIRGGLTSGISIKHFISDKSAIEGIIGTKWRGFSLTGLYELHTPTAFGVENLTWEYGGGAHIGTYRRYYKDRFYDYNRSFTYVGIVGIFGLEYKFDEIPFTLGADLMPYLDFIGYGGGFIDGSLSLRYILK